MTRFECWSKDHPFTLAVIVMMIMVIPGFAAFQQSLSRASDAATVARTSALQVNEQSDRNTQIIKCLTTYADGMTDALQDRDAVNKTTRVAGLEMWGEIHEWLSTQQPGSPRTPMLKSIEQYTEVLRRLGRHDAINPYPDINDCLDAPIAQPARQVFVLMSALASGTCWGEPVTIRGSHSSDTIHGTDGRDVIAGRGGGDLVLAGKGRDVICGGRGDDTINGGQDWDRARGGRGSDFCVQVEVTRSCH